MNPIMLISLVVLAASLGCCLGFLLGSHLAFSQGYDQAHADLDRWDAAFDPAESFGPDPDAVRWQITPTGRAFLEAQRSQSTSQPMTNDH